jgi:hypothetical protein
MNVLQVRPITRVKQIKIGKELDDGTGQTKKPFTPQRICTEPKGLLDLARPRVLAH